MKMKENAAIRKYKRKILHAVPYGMRKSLKTFLSEGIEEFCGSIPAPSMEDLVRQFGEPSSFAAEYFSHLEPAEYQRLFNNTKRIQRWCILSFLTVFLGTALAFQMILTTDRHSQVVYYYDSGCTVLPIVSLPDE